MAASVVYKDVRNTTGDTGKLFEGQSFWFSSAVPQRKWLIENATANGATVVPLEKQADVLIVDHARKNAPVGTHSYKYIEQSIRNGSLEDLADHVVGPSKSTDRPVGSITTAAKGSRNKYTEAEDQLLYNFIKPYENAGGTTGGNEIYKQLEDAHGNGRHTYQSWRDRWLKHVRFQDREITQSAYAGGDGEGDTPATPPIAKPSPAQPISEPVEAPAQSQRNAVGAAGLLALLSSQTRARPEASGIEDMTTWNARKALQRKLGRILPCSPGSLDTQRWNPAQVPPRPQDQARKEAVRVQRQHAGLGTYALIVEDVPDQMPMQSPYSAAEEAQEDKPPQNSQVGVEEFTDEEYVLLMNAAEHIIGVGEGVDDESWDKMAENYPTHSSTSWREFWVEKVKPDYEKKTSPIKMEQMSQEVKDEEEDVVLAEIAREESDEEETAQEGFQNAVPKRSQGRPGKSKTGKRGRPSRASALNENAAEPSGEEEVKPPHGESDEDDEALDEPMEADEERQTDENLEEAGANEDGLDSLFDGEVSESSQNTPPFTCKWSRCGRNLRNLFNLVKHVTDTHKPTPKEVADEHGWICRWNECSKITVDEYGNEVILDLQSRQEWVVHCYDEHIKPIHARHGLGFLMDQNKGARAVQEDEDESPLDLQDLPASQGAVQHDEDASLHAIQSPTISPDPHGKVAHLDGLSEEEDEVEDEVEDDEEDEEESEEAEESGSTSSSELESDIEISLNSNEDDEDRDRSYSPRRSKRLRNTLRAPPMKDLGFSYVDKAVGSSPPPSVQNTPAKGTINHTLRPLSPSVSKPPESNEARKRSPGKGNSQESTLSALNVQEVVEMHVEEVAQLSSLPSPRKRSREAESQGQPQESPELPPRTNFERKTKRRKELHHVDEPLEIPSTPEHRIILGELQDDDSMLNGSPTPRPRSRNGRGGTSLTGTPIRRTYFQVEDTEHTSPLHISILSDSYVEIALTSPARSISTRHDDLSSEPDLDFETAPQTATNLWGTAPSEEREEEEDTEQGVQYEAAQEPDGKGKARLETQDLFAKSIPDLGADEADPFALPEPEGGWPDDMDEDDVLGGPLMELPIPTSYQPPRAEKETEDDGDAASIPSDVPGWVDERTADDDSLDVEILLRAISATSGISRKLVIDVHDFIVSKQRRGEVETLPMYMKGCWTEPDDRALNSDDRHERARILKKHGRKSVERRLKWLNEEI